MKNKLFLSVLAVGLIVPMISVGTALAWHPKGVIVKYVQNQTTASELKDANEASSAIQATKGDTLKYVIEVKNEAEASNDGYNDMAFTKLTDTLPAGVELISNPSQREINEDLGTIKPGEKVTKEYLVRVNEVKDAITIENKACFTGDSSVKDNPQSGCDVANIVTKLPPVVTPTPTPTPQPQPEVKAETATLPNTGPAEVMLFALLVGISGYIASVFMQSRNFVSKDSK